MLRCSFDRHYSITDAFSIRCFDYSFNNASRSSIAPAYGWAIVITLAINRLRCTIEEIQLGVEVWGRIN